MAIRSELKENEKRLAKREDNLDSKLDTLTIKEKHLEKQEQSVADRLSKIEVKECEASELLEERQEALSRVAGMSREEGRRELLGALEHELTHEAGQLVSKILGEARENAMEQARKITLTAIQRYAAGNTCENTVSAVAFRRMT